MSKKVGPITLYDDGEDPVFPKGFAISFSFIPRSDLTWPHDERMSAYCKSKVETLVRLDLLSPEAMAFVKDRTGSVDVISEFPSFELAHAAFDKASHSGVVDIYVYENGVLREKYD